MTSHFNNFSRFFDRLAEKWAESSMIRTILSVENRIWNSFLIFLSVLFIGFFFAIGTVSGYFAELVRNQPVPDFKTLSRDINDYSESSVGYFAGNIPIGKMNSDLIRTKTALKDVSPNLVHAVIATEDELFYQHHGVVPKAVIRASFEQLLNEPQVTGGSSITQQLVKNQILTSEVSFARKAKEILLALRVEKFFSKDQILEDYLNIATFGRDRSGSNIAGAEAAAEGIFGVAADKLDIAQAAFIAGLPQDPFVYTPFTKQGDVKTDITAGVGRAHEVLQRMYDTGYISKSQLDAALNYDYRSHFAKPQKSAAVDYPYLMKEAADRSQTILAKLAAQQEGYDGDTLYNDYMAYQKVEYEYSRKLYGSKSAEEIAKLHGTNLGTLTGHYKIFNGLLQTAAHRLATGGYKIYTTINKPIYDSMQHVAQNYTGYSPDKIVTVGSSRTGKSGSVKDPMQVGSILIENRTGRIISFVGGRSFQQSEYNYATNVPRQNGSTMKPLLVYAPAMELGLIQPGSILPDLPYKRTINGQVYQPTDYGSTATHQIYHGFETARAALAQSDNVPAVSVFTRLNSVTGRAPDYLKKMGITTLAGSDGYNISAALGGIARGITVEENTNAFTTFANGGQFVDAYMIDKIVDGSGHVIYRHESAPVRVFSPQTSYLMVDMMRDVLKYGTGARLPGSLQFSADWAGKTGTSQDWRDSWLVASNPNVTLGVWNGYAHNEPMNPLTYSTQTRQLWAGFANGAYQIDPQLMDPAKRFEQPPGIVRHTFCGITDEQATPMCQAAGFVKTDLMNVKYLPNRTIEALEPAFTSPSGKGNSPSHTQPGQISGFRIKPDFLSTYFPFTDLQSADPALLGKIQK